MYVHTRVLEKPFPGILVAIGRDLGAPQVADKGLDRPRREVGWAFGG